MTRSDKIEKRKVRRHNRIMKRQAKRDKIRREMDYYDIKFSKARARINGDLARGHVCEMRYASCTESGVCNGDC